MKCPVLQEAYMLIREEYGMDRAHRSNVPLMNHIDEGLRILRTLGAGTWVQAAYCLHPLFQMDIWFIRHRDKLLIMPAPVVMFVMEYRNIANAGLSDQVERWTSTPVWTGPTLSPLPEVNMMLVADKVQNRADFELHHKGTHPNSDRLDTYFKVWLKTLGVLEENYTELAAVAKTVGM